MRFLFLATLLIHLSFQGELNEKEIADFSQKVFNAFHYQEATSFESLILSLDEITQFIESNDDLRDREKERYLDNYENVFEKQEFRESLLESFDAMMSTMNKKNLQGQLRFLNYNLSLYEAEMDHLYAGEVAIEVRIGNQTDYLIVPVLKGPFGYRIYGELYFKTLQK